MKKRAMGKSVFYGQKKICLSCSALKNWREIFAIQETEIGEA